MSSALKRALVAFLMTLPLSISGPMSKLIESVWKGFKAA
jgi:hypothetical protein